MRQLSPTEVEQVRMTLRETINTVLLALALALPTKNVWGQTAKPLPPPKQEWGDSSSYHLLIYDSHAPERTIPPLVLRIAARLEDEISLPIFPAEGVYHAGYEGACNNFSSSFHIIESTVKCQSSTKTGRYCKETEIRELEEIYRVAFRKFIDFSMKGHKSFDLPNTRYSVTVKNCQNKC